MIQFLSGRMPADRAATVDEHLDSCSACRDLVFVAAQGSRATADDLAQSPTLPGARPGDELARGTSVGRYMIVDVLGSGGMGVVYAAFDPELDRKVALKLLRHDTGGDAALRLRREARAIAKLAHPNVVGVFDVGSHQGAVFIAMELVDGRSLDAWIHEKPRPWREIVDVFLQAGAGLVAAHEAGMVHRDVKPANVLVGNDGRVRVTDFGLAQISAGDAPRASDPARMAEVADRLTQTGSIVGTPAYMSPEQLDAGRADAKTDQFSFAVALYEGLYAERPFEGRTVAEIYENVRAGNVRADRGSAGVPPWVREIVLRALRADPKQRYPSLAAMLAELRKDPALRRRRRVIGGLAGTAALGAIVAAFTLGSRSTGADCDRAGEAIAGVWNDGSKQALRRTLSKPTADHVVATLDRYRAGWQAMRVGACKSHRVDNTRSAAVFDAQMRCLDGRLESLRTLLEAVGGKASNAADQPIDGAINLPKLADCEAEQVSPASTESSRADVVRAQRLIDRADALDDLGRIDEAYKLLDQVVFERPAPATQARATCLRASLDELKNKYDAALLGFERCAELAAQGGDDRLLAGAWLGAIGVEGFRLGRATNALSRTRMAEAALTRAGRPAILVARYHHMRGLVRQTGGDLVGSREDYTEAYRLFSGPMGDLRSASTTLGALASVDFAESKPKDALARLESAEKLAHQLYGPTHAKVLTIANNIALVLDDLGRNKESIERQEAALERTEELLGTHTLTAIAAHNLAETYEVTGDLTRAHALHERGLAIRKTVFGEKHVDTADSYEMLAGTELMLGEHDKAIALVSKALEIKRGALPANDPKLTGALYELARIYYGQGKIELAYPLAKEVLAIREAEVPQRRSSLAVAVGGFATTAIDLGKWDEGCAAADRARALRIEISGPDAPQLASMELELAKCAGHAGKWKEAVARIDRALAIKQGGDAPTPLLTAELELDASRLLRQHRPLHGRARALEAAAEKRLRAVGDQGKPLLDKLAGDRKKNPRPWK